MLNVNLVMHCNSLHVLKIMLVICLATSLALQVMHGNVMHYKALLWITILNYAYSFLNCDELKNWNCMFN